MWIFILHLVQTYLYTQAHEILVKTSKNTMVEKVAYGQAKKETLELTNVGNGNIMLNVLHAASAPKWIRILDALPIRMAPNTKFAIHFVFDSALMKRSKSHRNSAATCGL